jgi:hypothetical protein
MKNKKMLIKNALKRKNIKSLDKKTFLKLWKAIAFVYPGLHPECDGWPKKLKPVVSEAFRRLEIGEFSDSDFYQVGEAMKGLEKARQNTRNSL